MGTYNSFSNFQLKVLAVAYSKVKASTTKMNFMLRSQQDMKYEVSVVRVHFNEEYWYNMFKTTFVFFDIYQFSFGKAKFRAHFQAHHKILFLSEIKNNDDILP